VTSRAVHDMRYSVQHRILLCLALLLEAMTAVTFSVGMAHVWYKLQF
jgi:hypothetical protein